MPLQINLYHEVLRAKREKQYDPLKLSMLGLLVVALMLAGWYGVQLKRTSDAKGALASEKAEFDRLSPLAKAAQEKEAELNKKAVLAEKLASRMEKRFYWAPVIECVVLATPPSVQLTKVACDVGRDRGGLCQVTVEGVAVGEEPRAVAEETRKAVNDRLAAKYASVSATFRNLDDRAEAVKVGGRPMASVVFTISATFKPEADAAQPPKRIAQAR